MKLFVVLCASISAGYASADHLYSFLIGLYIAALAVSACYWFAFRSSRFPQLALFLLLCGMLAKLGVTVFGTIWALSRDLISSPFIYSLSYLFFSIAITYLWFSYKDKLTWKALGMDQSN
ncbi:NADH:ubiquinone oxidoreductase [Vibrio sp. SM6]|uniref:NADH:ubiquinone oxidoreductase n=1 Tax=Vibrio agarilyticus TaxID=2726741 RepID=A0A7X8YHG1_9VIBR|nr:NADH:ubiquinone oxidoreductase [Vibrio agarilyticus]NLS13451.1 NADH:ubiquinone oxidoreductase [Vibrio agarilyticus]